ncbi:3-isopropylmalate dehydratase large subunit [Peribacillus psychrosaccharolyticus]|uniref:3-isopropylmalate dehydratase large subunit n=1 Tax=Peribacillus psychrosaccharolyticus TaxID=1407 RepID=A0A974S0W6_PERPY|nr:3-isopropylmalate dehydratase large subunit [Peribacillus psychrosaccharolyticus]MEC2054615.1 3-isopropylmalate dehydratase large subunit [Peribacillus psychrosaccharolyticus]MED3744158.1 3-isopropylmalate dehydratase large subunit [Peribacillus psychrosaccharolyticus]QQS99649.1 3-isopropylmalate dehydratase large subunit [Peribacillus psychrosaccharolyticus]
MGKSIIEKIWDRHIVSEEQDKPDLLYVDLHYIHEVTSPQAFEGIRMKGRSVRRPERTFATMDHNVPTVNRYFIQDEIAKKQLDALAANCQEFGIHLADLTSSEQGIVHVIGPELGLTQPGMTIVCGDSHTSTHGAFGSIAFGIGTSEVEHVLATQTIWQTKPKTLKLEVNGELGYGVTSKDVILYVISRFGVDFGTGHIIEYCGEVFRNMSMEERMTVCNMSIEGGARAGLVSPDDTTYSYMKGRKYAPESSEFDRCVEEWSQLASDVDAVYDREIVLDGSEIPPMVSWGTNPGMATGVDGFVPSITDGVMDSRELGRALEYMGLNEGMAITDIPVQHVFIGSCTNSRIEDLRKAAAVLSGQHVHPGVRAMVVPGSQSVKKQAEEEGLDVLFKAAGFEWRESGCSMCLSMNPDVVPAGEHCASTSNRNFEGRQGAGARTHLVSPAMAATAALYGRFVDIRKNERIAELVR